MLHAQLVDAHSLSLAPKLPELTIEKLPLTESCLGYIPPQVSDPPFIAQEGWLSARVEEIWAGFHAKDNPSGSERVRPMALVRCTRGGKSRALIEIERKLSLCEEGKQVVLIRIFVQ